MPEGVTYVPEQVVPMSPAHTLRPHPNPPARHPSQGGEGSARTQFTNTRITQRGSDGASTLPNTLPAPGNHAHPSRKFQIRQQANHESHEYRARIRKICPIRGSIVIRVIDASLQIDKMENLRGRGNCRSTNEKNRQWT
jgi:hypothetical protein